MPNPTSSATKPAGSIADRAERIQTTKSNDSEDGAALHQQVREQAILLQELVTSFRASEDMRLLTVQRNKKLAEENKRLKDKIKFGSFDSVTNKGVESPGQMSTAKVSSTISMKPSAVASSGSTVTLTKEQMSELTESVAALKEVAFRRENTWERMARRQVALQRQIKTLKDAAMLTDLQLRDGARTIKDQAAALKRDQRTIASLKKQMNLVAGPQRVDKSPSVVEVMAPPARRAPRSSTTGEPLAAMPTGCRASTQHGALHVDSTGSRSSSRREHQHGRRDRYSDRGQVVDKDGLYVEKSGHYEDKSGHNADRRIHILSDRREHDHVTERRYGDHGSVRTSSESASPLKQKRVVVAGSERYARAL